MFPRPMTPGSEIQGAGGAYVRRRFTFGDRELKSGDRLSLEDIRSMPLANLNSLINIGMIELYPAAPATGGDCFLMPASEDGKKFHVIQGRQVTDKPMPRAQALAKTKELTS